MDTVKNKAANFIGTDASKAVIDNQFDTELQEFSQLKTDGLKRLHNVASLGDLKEPILVRITALIDRVEKKIDDCIDIEKTNFNITEGKILDC